MQEIKVVREDGSNIDDYFAGRSRGGSAAEPGVWYNDVLAFNAVLALTNIMSPALGEYLAELAAEALHDRLVEVNREALYSLLKGVE